MAEILILEAFSGMRGKNRPVNPVNPVNNGADNHK